MLPRPTPTCRYLSADVDMDGVAALRESLKQQGTKVGQVGRGWG